MDQSKDLPNISEQIRIGVTYLKSFGSGSLHEPSKKNEFFLFGIKTLLKKMPLSLKPAGAAKSTLSPSTGQGTGRIADVICSILEIMKNRPVTDWRVKRIGGGKV